MRIHPFVVFLFGLLNMPGLYSEHWQLAYLSAICMTVCFVAAVAMFITDLWRLRL